MADFVMKSFSTIRVWLILFAITQSFALYAQEGSALVLLPKGEVFQEVVSGMEDDIGEDIEFHQVFIDKSSTEKDVASAIDTHSPDVILLLGNRSISVYAKYQNSNKGSDFPPSIGMAALFVDSALSKVSNATGIRYEIPAVTSVVNMRGLMKKPVKKVGVVYRAWMEDIIAENRAYCESEGIELVGVKLPNKDSKMDKKVKSALEDLVDEDIEALWLLNDNALLSGAILSKAWIPSLGKQKLPVIVGVKSLLATKFNLGTFAVVPDHYGLGVQAASVLGDLLDEDWELGDRDIEQPLSVKKIVNIALLDKKRIATNKASLVQVDEVIEQ